MNVVGYVRVSTREQGDGGLGLDAQRHAIVEACRLRGWQLVAVHEDVASGRSTSGRPGLAAARAACRGRGRKAQAIVVARLDRVARNMADFALLAEETKVISLDPFIDMTDAAGEAMANMLMTFAVFERRLIAQRISAAMMVKKRAGWIPPQHQPRHTDPRLVARVLELRDEGKGLRATARVLEGEGCAVRHPKQVARILQRAA